MRKLALAMAVAMAAGRANALGLGDIELHSALNEPLNAEVHLLAEQPGELNNAVVRLATSEEFAQAGIERPGALSDIKFTIERHDDGTAVVKITSTQPIHEPFLDFIMQLNWQSGRLLREYTLLLDPPVFGEEKSAPVSAPVTAPSPAAEGVPTVAEDVPPAAVPQQAPQGIAAPGETPSANVVHKTGANGEQNYGPTRRDETLWGIASGLRPDDSVSVYQMMMALLKANPQAFYGNNVNALKAGYVLRVPEKSVVAAVNEEEAVREAARQYERWQQAKRRVGTPPEGGTVSEPAAEAGQAAQPAAAAKEQEKETARLHLVAPGEAAAKSAAAGGAQAELEKLRGELAIAMESSDTSKRESDEMRSRVAALEQQISSLQHLLTLKDEALGQMQKRAGAAVPQAAQKSGPALEVPSPAVAPKPAPITKPAAPAKPAPKAAEASSGLLANPTLLGAVAGAGLLLASVAWLIVRRRRGRTEDSEPEAEMGFNDALLPAGSAEPAQEGQAAASIEELQNDANLTQVAEEVAQLVEPNIQQAASDLDLLHTPEGDIDPIVEADVYLAYRRYQQAESLVQNALAKQPQRYELKAKLLEIHYVSKNDKAFQTVAQELYENLGNNSGDPLWQRILPMGRELCPDHVLFRSPADSRVSQESLDTDIGGGGSVLSHQEEKMDFDLNLSADAPAAAQIQESPASLSQSSEFKDTTVKTSGKKESAAARGGQAPEAEAQKSWEIESAVSDFGNIDFGLEDSDVLAGTDVVGTKLDLARAYIDMGDKESAGDILKEVVEEGNQQQKQEAKTLMEGIA